MCSWTESDSGFRWFMKGTVKELISRFFPLISSFNWSFYISFFPSFKDTLHKNKPLSVLSLTVTASLKVLMTDTSWVPRGHDLTCLLFCGYALTPAECWLTVPLAHSGGIQCQDSTLSHSAVCLMLFWTGCASVILIKAEARLLSHSWIVFRACPLIVIQWNWHELFSVLTEILSP